MPKAFVYGAQMLHPGSLRAAWPAKVSDHAVRFVASGLPLFEPVFASLETAPGETAYGVIVDFSEAAWAALLAHENSYDVVEIEAELLEPDDARELGTDTLRCQAFRVRPGRRARAEGRPSARYARKLAKGASEHRLPPEIVQRYEQAAADGGRASLALEWLYPIASRIGLVPTAILLLLLLMLFMAAVIVLVMG